MSVVLTGAVTSPLSKPMVTVRIVAVSILVTAAAMVSVLRGETNSPSSTSTSLLVASAVVVGTIPAVQVQGT